MAETDKAKLDHAVVSIGRLTVDFVPFQTWDQHGNLVLILPVRIAIFDDQFALLKNHPNQDVTGCAQCESKRIYRE